MAIPLILGGLAVAAGTLGAKKAYDGYQDNEEAKRLQNKAESIIRDANTKLDNAKKEANNALKELGRKKVELFTGPLINFHNIFKRIKNIELQESFAQEDINSPEHLQVLIERISTSFTELAAGGIASIGAGALAGIGAYGGVGMLATASTGTAISALSGAAATNATLAWLGGGSLAAGGFGMAGGTLVLGGLVTGPILAVGGFLYASKAEENLENAKSNLKKAEVEAKKIQPIIMATNAITEITQEGLRILIDLEKYLVAKLPVFELLVLGEKDFNKYNDGQKDFVWFMVSLAQTIVGICNLDVLDEDGKIHKNFKEGIESANDFAKELLEKY